MKDTCTVLAFLTEIALGLSLALRQTTEERVHRCYWMYAELPESMRDDPDLITAHKKLAAAALAFRDTANSDPDFVIFKILVGFNSVFPPAWTDRSFRYDQAGEYRSDQVCVLLEAVDQSSAEVWFERVCRYARTESDDAATFPVFARFLERLAELQPTIVISYIDRLEGPLTSFLPAMLAGLMRSAESSEALARIDAWVRSGQNLGQIAWYLRSADSLDEAMLRRVLASAIQHGDRRAVRNVLLAAVSQFGAHPGNLVDEVFLPALRNLQASGDFSWVQVPWVSWLGSPIVRSLNADQAGVVFEALISYPVLEYDAEHIVAAIAKRWPELVLDFIGRRLELARSASAPEGYDALPFTVNELQSPLSSVPDTMLASAREWFDADPSHFGFDGARFIAGVFPDLSAGLDERMKALIADANEGTLQFVLEVLSAYEGRACVYELLRMIVAALDRGSRLIGLAHSVLHQSGVIRGEFGGAELYAERMVMIEPWLADANESVRIFAADEIRDLDRWIASETRSAEAEIALRRLNHGEELDGGAETAG